MGFPQRCQYRRNALLLICVTHLWRVRIKNLLCAISYWLSVHEVGGGLVQLRDRWMEERTRETKAKKKPQGRKGKRGKRAALKLQLRLLHQSDPVRYKTNQCRQLGCGDWQQLHWSQMEMKLQSDAFTYISSVFVVLCTITHPYHSLNSLNEMIHQNQISTTGMAMIFTWHLLKIQTEIWLCNSLSSADGNSKVLSCV